VQKYNNDHKNVILGVTQYPYPNRCKKQQQYIVKIFR